jgi:SpoVK/Ycf46/Vps4 family AAA+-type ATPase
MVRKMTYEYVPKLVRAALNNDKKNVESIALLLGRKLKKEAPDVSAEIMKILACSNTGSDVMRSIDMSPIPVDKETRSQLVKLEEPMVLDDPILEDSITEELNLFIQERGLIERFLAEDIIPSNSLLLHGKPGVGKTYIAKWLSYKLNMPIITLDLANSISSYLGRSGQNIKSIFQYTKDQNVILFLDEIDAIAKRRDDASDLGELKRLVNVLLKELEECPVSCVVIGATNHPELLDKAIWRRFDRNIEISMPEYEQRKQLILRGLRNQCKEMDKATISILTDGTDGISAADICKLCEHIKRRTIIYPDQPIETLALKEYCEYVGIKTKDQKKAICKAIKTNYSKISVKKISEMTGIPTSSVGRYLKE